MATLASRLLSWTPYGIAFLLCSSTVHAQFQPRPITEPASAERFHIEASAAIWRPSADIVISSEGFGIPGTSIDFKRDLGLADQALPEFKFTLQPVRSQKLRAELATPSPSIREFTQAQFPLGALGGIARVYVVPGVSITGEMTGFKISHIGDVHDGNWTDVDIYGTANFTKNVGAQIGFRSVDLGYAIKSDTGSLTLKGIYFGVVARY